jgi:hypothetical protein
MTIELRDTRGRLIGRIDERWQAPAALCPLLPRPALAEVREDRRAQRGEVGREEVRA